MALSLFSVAARLSFAYPESLVTEEGNIEILITRLSFVFNVCFLFATYINNTY